MSNSLLVVNADGPETRVALVQGGLMGELYIERKRDRGIAGNIYKGRVDRILPGMQAAFVNIGLEKSAYLHVSDVRGTPDDLKRLLSGGDGRSDEDEDDAPGPSGAARIEDLLKEGQEIIVQVTKEPISTKGARTTRYVSLPGRHLVFMPTVDHVGISRRIGSDKERRRLRDIVDQMRPAGSGFIVRTVAEGIAEKDLRADMEFLIKLWNEIVKRTETARCPSAIYSDLDLLLRTVRDLFTADVERLIIDSRPEYDRVKKFITAFMPEFTGRIELYEGTDPIFDGFGIEIEIDRALERKVWLKSGGYLIVDEMEALTAIDINTGRFVGKKNLEDTITQTNLEAAREVAEQLRIRSIGGMIVVDFIDMDRSANREKVMRLFNEQLKRDRNKAQVTRISELGLVEMSRKRTRESLLHTLTEPCSHCEGKGYTKSRTTVAYEVLRELRRTGDLVEGDTVLVELHPDVAQVMAGPDRVFLEDMEKRLQKRIIVKARGSFHMEDFEIRTPGEKPLEKSEIAAGGDRNEPKKPRRRKRVLGPPAEVEAMLEEEERATIVNPEFMGDVADAARATVAARSRQANPREQAREDALDQAHQAAHDQAHQAHEHGRGNGGNDHGRGPANDRGHGQDRGQDRGHDRGQDRAHPNDQGRAAGLQGQQGSARGAEGRASAAREGRAASTSSDSAASTSSDSAASTSSDSAASTSSDSAASNSSDSAASTSSESPVADPAGRADPAGPADPAAKPVV